MSSKKNDISKVQTPEENKKIQETLVTPNLKQDDITNAYNPLISTNYEWCGYSWRDYPIMQAPPYPDQEKLIEAELELRKTSEIVTYDEIIEINNQLQQISFNNGFIIQVGDCAETFRHSDIGYTTQRISLFAELNRLISNVCSGPVLTMGRMAGQFAKPRSALTEIIDGDAVSNYFGDVVNSNMLDDREPNPERILIGYQVAFDTAIIAKHFSNAWQNDLNSNFKYGENFYLCHEAYLLPYEQNLLRLVLPQNFHVSSSQSNYIKPFKTDDIKIFAPTYSSSAHFLWIGERTRAINHAHVEFARRIENPVGVKIGPSALPEDLGELIRVLNPHHIPGKLSFIFRLGSQQIHKLVHFVEYLIRNNLQKDVLFICDPMHGNTTKLPLGLKTRKIKDIYYEIDTFFKILTSYKLPVSGIHLEATPHKVYECIDTEDYDDYMTSNEDVYLSVCDPRLNSEQVLYLMLHVSVLLQINQKALK